MTGSLRIAGAALLLTSLAACQSGGDAPAPGGEASAEAHNLARSVGNTIAQCWFGSGDPTFASYIYSPEPNAQTPRVLIVRRDQPAERPVLVIEAAGARTLNTYGPLADGAAGPRIRADLDRWARGSGSCT